VIYLANPCTPKVRAIMQSRPDLGMISTPKQGNKLMPGVVWCADNGVFGKGYPGDATFLTWMRNRAHAADSCLFVVAPDVVGDALATLERSRPWLPVIRSLGYKAAFVAQDGMQHMDPPWEDFDVLFIGGSTEFKHDPLTRLLIAEAKARGKWVHMGRVNSRKRFLYSQWLGCDSADGTYVAFGPDKNIHDVVRWLDEAADLQEDPGE
jgi:hypothetical protein